MLLDTQMQSLNSTGKQFLFSLESVAETVTLYQLT